VLQQMFRRPRPELVSSLSGGVLLFCAIGALAALLLLGRGPGGPGRALVVLLAVGAALVAGHLVDAVLPRPQVAPGVPRGLLGLGASVLVGAAVAFLGRGLAEPAALAYGAGLGLLAGLMGLAASYVVVDLTAAGRVGSGDDATSPWILAVVQATLPLAACAPVALALQMVL
jgi:hypothetical protein